jgi:hypothetical protein
MPNKNTVFIYFTKQNWSKKMIDDLLDAIIVLRNDVKNAEKLSQEKKNALNDKLNKLQNSINKNANEHSISAEIIQLTNEITDAITASNLETVINNVQPILDAHNPTDIQSTATALGNNAANAFAKSKKSKKTRDTAPSTHSDDNGVPDVYTQKAPNRFLSLFCCCPVKSRPSPNHNKDEPLLKNKR